MLLLALACASAPRDTALDSDAAPAEPMPPEGRLLIEELYYTGAAEGGGVDHYYADQFIEIMNISDAPVELAGLMLGDIYGLSGAINRGDQPDGFAQADPEHVYLSNVWRVPDDGDSLLQPGETAVIAHDGVNHQPLSSVDLTLARWEAYVEQSGRDEDAGAVPNLEPVLFTGGYDWLMTVFGPAVVLLSPDAELEERQVSGRRVRVASNSAVIDGVEALMDADSGDFKRLPSAVDVGFAYASGTYVGESMRRLRVDGVPQDSDDSSVDFEIGPPEPGS